jgi:hypothetical protein
MLAGLDKREVRARLGVPEGHLFGDDSWSYAVGPGQGLLGKSSGAEESLAVRALGASVARWNDGRSTVALVQGGPPVSRSA